MEIYLFLALQQTLARDHVVAIIPTAEDPEGEPAASWDKIDEGVCAHSSSIFILFHYWTAPQKKLRFCSLRGELSAF